MGAARHHRRRVAASPLIQARAAAAGRANVIVMVNDINRGKGYSVRRGFLAAKGERVAFIDADLS